MLKKPGTEFMGGRGDLYPQLLGMGDIIYFVPLNILW